MVTLLNNQVGDPNQGVLGSLGHKNDDYETRENLVPEIREPRQQEREAGSRVASSFCFSQTTYWPLMKFTVHKKEKS